MFLGQGADTGLVTAKGQPQRLATPEQRADALVLYQEHGPSEAARRIGWATPLSVVFKTSTAARALRAGYSR